jgi:hypothetical protein
MDTTNRHFISFMVRLARATRTDGVLQRILDEVPRSPA